MWTFWDDGDAIPEGQVVRRIVPVRGAELSSLRPLDGAWSATWAPRGPQREPEALHDASVGSASHEFLPSTEFVAVDSPPGAAVGASEASQAGQAPRAAWGSGPQREGMPDDEFDSPQWSEDECSDLEGELAQQLAREAGEARELAAALEPAQEARGTGGGSRLQDGGSEPT